MLPFSTVTVLYCAPGGFLLSAVSVPGCCLRLGCVIEGLHRCVTCSAGQVGCAGPLCLLDATQHALCTAGPAKTTWRGAIGISMLFGCAVSDQLCAADCRIAVSWAFLCIHFHSS